MGLNSRHFFTRECLKIFHFVTLCVGCLTRSNSEQLLPPVAALGLARNSKTESSFQVAKQSIFPKTTWAVQQVKNLKCKWFYFLRILELKKWRSAIPFLDTFLDMFFFKPNGNNILSNYFQISHQIPIECWECCIKNAKQIVFNGASFIFSIVVFSLMPNSISLQCSKFFF